jgi:hypothetical protein
MTITRRGFLQPALAAPVILKGSSAAAALLTSTQTPIALLPTVSRLPDPFQFNSGLRAADRAQWFMRRAELKEQLCYYQFGHVPPPAAVTVVSTDTDVVIGPMTKRVVHLKIGGSIPLDVLLYIPNSGGPFPNGIPGPGPYPLLLGSDESWSPIEGPFSASENASVGTGDLQAMVSRGYIVASFGRDQISLDTNDDGFNFSQGVFTLYPHDVDGVTGYDWGVLMAWAWGFSRCVDFFMTLSYVDHAKICVTGHSRGGKAALLAGALDERIALVGDNMSETLGLGPMRNFSTDTNYDSLVSNYPGWFNSYAINFTSGAGHGGWTKCPYDSHGLVALLAPRANIHNIAMGLTAPAEQDHIGNAQANQAALEVYTAMGAADKLATFWGNTGHEFSIGYWANILDFADKVFFDFNTKSPAASAIALRRSYDWVTVPFSFSPNYSWLRPF